MKIPDTKYDVGDFIKTDIGMYGTITEIEVTTSNGKAGTSKYKVAYSNKAIHWMHVKEEEIEKRVKMVEV